MNDVTTETASAETDRRPTRLAHLVLATALVLGAVLFVIGTRGERQTSTADASAPTTSTFATTTLLGSPAAPAATVPVTSTTVPPAEGTQAHEAQEHGATTVPATIAGAADTVLTNAGPAATAAVPAEGTPSREAAEGAGHVETAAEQSSEKILGVNLESAGVIAGVVTLSIALAAMVLTRRSRAAVWVAASFCALAAAADAHELRIQADRSQTGLAVVAATVAAIHVVGAIAGTVAARQPTSR